MVHSVAYCDGAVSIKSIEEHQPNEEHHRQQESQSANDNTTAINHKLLFTRSVSDETVRPSTPPPQHQNRALSKFNVEHNQLNSFKKTMKKSANKMNRKPSLKHQTTIEGYLEILDTDEVELRNPHTLKLHHIQMDDEKLLIDRPFSYPPKMPRTVLMPDDDDQVYPEKRDSFLRQSFNTIRKSLRLKNKRKGKSVDDELTDALRHAKQNDKNNNKCIQFEKLENVTTSDEGLNGSMKIKKIGKHLRNSSLGSYFLFR